MLNSFKMNGNLTADVMTFDILLTDTHNIGVGQDRLTEMQIFSSFQFNTRRILINEESTHWPILTYLCTLWRK